VGRAGIRVGPSQTGRDRAARDRPGPRRVPGGVKRCAVSEPGAVGRV